jgi:hypothetical protein
LASSLDEFLAGGIAQHQAALACAHSIVFPWQTRARVRRNFVCDRWLVRYGIWYATNELVKARHRVEVLKTWVS